MRDFYPLCEHLELMTAVTPCPYESENDGTGVYINKIDTWGWQSFKREGA